jgi:NAD(P)-dependent dehydrogenase (short-subunit alcohol dehydrogenase family)
MNKTILITGATDGIGLATAKMLATKGHNLLIHGRNSEKLKQVEGQLAKLGNTGVVQTYLADLSKLSEVKALADRISDEYEQLDVLINNAGVLKVSDPITEDGLDVRFCVNTIAPFLLAQQLAPNMRKSGRIVNLSSAAQAPVDIAALQGKKKLTDMQAYSQSKLAITMWTKSFGEIYKENGPTFIAVNPGSLLASKMVNEGFVIPGNDINIGAKILVRMALDEDVSDYSGQYFDNDKGAYSLPHPDGLNAEKSEKIIEVIETILCS